MPLHSTPDGLPPGTQTNLHLRRPRLAAGRQPSCWAAGSSVVTHLVTRFAEIRSVQGTIRPMGEWRPALMPGQSCKTGKSWLK